MACRSVNNLRLSRDDMRNIYREQACGRKNGVKISHILKVLEILVPVIVPFFHPVNGVIHRDNANANFGNKCSMGYAGEDDMPFHMECGSNGNGNSRSGYSHGYMGRAEDYGDRIISEEEFERLLDYAEQCNVKMY